MKTLILRSFLAAALAAFALTGNAQQPAERPGPGDRVDRMERLERRLNELAERQEQFMRRVGAQLERRNQPDQFAGEPMHPPGPGPAAGPDLKPIHGSGAKVAKDISGLIGLLCLIGFICNILLAIWIYTDIRKRNEGSGIFVAMALVAGIPAAIIYALTRIGDKKT